MAKSNPGMVLTDRDARLVRYLYDMKIATFRQVNRDVFGNLSKGTLSRRLSKLAKADLINCVPIRMNGINMAFQSSKKGIEVLLHRKESDNFVKVASEVPNHDMTLNDLRYSFGRFENVKWYLTENQLRQGELASTEIPIETFQSVRSDAALGIFHNGVVFNCALECETTAKARERYESKIKSYYTLGKIDCVIYLFKEENYRNIICEIDKSVRPKDHAKVFTALVDNVLSDKDELKLENSLRQSLTLLRVQKPSQNKVQTSLQNQCKSAANQFAGVKNCHKN